MIKKGFTVVEIAIVLVMIAALSMILIPTLTKSNPNKEHLMFRKAYNLVTSLVYDLVNDEELYPEPTTPGRPGQLFNLGNTSRVEEDGIEYEGDTKFCNLMVTRMNTLSVSATPCVEKQFINGQIPDSQFATSDGMEWILPITSFDNANANHLYSIQIDVNGNKAPNCFYVDENNCAKPDRFTIKIRRDGKIFVDGVKEIQYLEDSNVTGG